MDSYQRHLKAWRVLQPLVRMLVTPLFHLSHEDLRVDGPVLLVPNHTNAWDPLLVSTSLKEKQVYYVASEHLFRLGFVSKIIDWAVAPIPRRKASVGTDTVKACLRHLKQGHSICLFAEGEQCWDGITGPVFPATGKLAKTSGATLVTFRVEGGYLSLPRWGKKIRRGEIFVHPVGIYPPEQLKKMTAEEVNAVIERDIHENAWERQRQKPVRYRGKRRAEGMERALFACPGCRRIGTLRTAEDRVFCDCGFSRRYSETGFFASETPFASIAEWDRWQMQLLRDRSFLHEGNLLFSDRDMILTRILSDHTEEQLATGTLYQYEDRLVCEGQSFALAEISSMAIVQTHLLLLSCGGEYYQLRTKTAANLRKYLEVWKEK